MDELNSKRLDSVIQTVAFCELPASVTATAGIANFAPQVVVVKGKVLIIQSYNLIGNATTSGVTLNVKAIRASMEQHTYLLANAIFSYAASLTPPDNNLMALSKLTSSSLEGMTKQNCATECDRIRQLAAANAAAIAPFGASATDITDTASLVTLYMTGIDDPRGALITRNNAKKQALLTLNETISVELELKLDTMANTLRFTNNEWWLQYRAAREIIDPGTFTTVLKILVLNKAINEPLLSVKAYRDGQLTFKKSSKKGFITFKDLDEGAHSFVLRKKRFKDYTLTNVMISHGKKMELVAKMEPILTGEDSNSVVREGLIPPASIANINVEGINTTDESTVTLDLPAELVFYFSATAGAPPSGTTWEASAGTQTISVEQFKLLTGFASVPGEAFLNVQNNALVPVTYKLTFNNLEE